MCSIGYKRAAPCIGKIDMSTSYDVIVVGLGAMGSATTYDLAKRGLRVLGLERFTPAHDQGSSHGRSRIIRQAYMEHPDYVPLLLRAYELWAEIEQASGQSLLTITGGLMMGRAGSHVVTGSQRSAQEHNLPHEMLNADEIRRRYPEFRPNDDTVALFCPNDGLLDPEASIRAYHAQAAALGADLHFGEPMLQWQPDGDGVRVTTAQGSYHASRLVLSVGAWAPEVMADLNLPLSVERRVLYWFEPQNGTAAFQPDRFPIYIWETPMGFDMYGFPAQDGPPGGVKVAFHNIGDEDRCTPDTIDREVRPAEIARIRDMLSQTIPSLNGELLATATCMYTLTPDHHFLVGLHPQHSQVVLASPCSGHGFKFASVMGEILADLAQQGSTRHPISLFDINRFAKQ
jgi:sarcosine oxidase